MKINVTVTDTFNGEANYSWVRKYSCEMLDASSKYSVVRRVKRLIGWNGRKCLVVDYNDTLEVRPHGACVVAFVEFGA